jgi:hypothetical protein
LHNWRKLEVKLFEQMAKKPNQTARYGDVRQFAKTEAAKPE